MIQRIIEKVEKTEGAAGVASTCASVKIENRKSSEGKGRWERRLVARHPAGIMEKLHLRRWRETRRKDEGRRKVGVSVFKKDHRGE